MFVEKSKKILILVTFTVMFLIGLAQSASASVDITISGLENFDLAAFDLNLNYDDGTMIFMDYTLTEELGSFDLLDAEDWSFGDDGFGTVNLAVVSYLFDFSSQSDSFTLATVNFDFDGDVYLSDIVLSDEFGDAIPFTVNGTDISAVPVPGAIWLLGSAFAGIIGIRRRNQK